MGFLGRFEPQIYALVRVVIGFLFMLHGTQKLFMFPPFPKMCPCPGDPVPDMASMATFLTVVGIMELVFGLMVFLGFFTRLGAFLASGMMAVAYFIGHQSQGALPHTNQGEPAVLYCFIFLLIAAIGPVICSIDSMMAKSKAAKNDGS
jgi:putative oxidoreductase